MKRKESEEIRRKNSVNAYKKKEIDRNPYGEIIDKEKEQENEKA